MNFSKFNDLDLEEKIVESNFNNDLQLLRKIFLDEQNYKLLLNWQNIFRYYEVRDRKVGKSFKFTTIVEVEVVTTNLPISKLFVPLGREQLKY